jgi:hypothetical protein
MIGDFEKLTKLKSLWLLGAVASASDAKTLKEVLPDCDVEFFTDLEDSSESDEEGRRSLPVGMKMVCSRLC